MANPRMSLLQLLDKAEAGADPESLRDGLRLLVQELMDVEVTQLVGAGPYERSDTASPSGPLTTILAVATGVLYSLVRLLLDAA